MFLRGGRVCALPTQLLTHVGVILQRMERGGGETNLRRYVAGHVRELGDAYAELFEVVRRNIEEPYNDENIARIFDRAADQVCVKCSSKTAAGTRNMSIRCRP